MSWLRKLVDTPEVLLDETQAAIRRGVRALMHYFSVLEVDRSLEDGEIGAFVDAMVAYPEHVQGQIRAAIASPQAFVESLVPSERAIAERAYAHYQERADSPGSADDDGLAAEQDFREDRRVLHGFREFVFSFCPQLKAILTDASRGGVTWESIIWHHYEACRADLG